MNGCRWVCGWPLDPVSVRWMYVRVRGCMCGCMCGCPCEWVCVLDTIPYSIHSRNSACHLALHLPVDSESSWLGDGHEMNGFGGLTGTDLSIDWFFCLFPAGFPILPAQAFFSLFLPPYLSQSGSLRPEPFTSRRWDGWKIGLQSPARVFFYFWNILYTLFHVWHFYFSWSILIIDLFLKRRLFFFKKKIYLFSGESAILYLYEWLSTSSSTSLSPSSTPTPPYNTVSSCS